MWKYILYVCWYLLSGLLAHSTFRYIHPVKLCLGDNNDNDQVNEFLDNLEMGPSCDNVNMTLTR
jgi:hypothetical protein